MKTQPIRLLFAGTGNFGVPILEALAADPHFEIAGVITAMDKPQGRKQIVTPTEVKNTANRLGLAVYCPTSKDEIRDVFTTTMPDLALVVAYGVILPSDILHIPKFGCINVHGSILPKYRGASPIHAAILNGDTDTGNSWTIMERKMDTGPIIATDAVKIAQNETFSGLYKKLAQSAAEHTPSNLLHFIETNQSTTQSDSLASYCSIIDKNDGLIDFSKMKTSEIYNKFRAYDEWPNVYFKAKEMSIKITQCTPAEQNNYSNAEAGTFIVLGNKKLLVKTLDGAIELIELQPASKKPMLAVSFIQGYKNLLNPLIEG